MLQEYHKKITEQALGEIVSETALQKIIEANVYQDRLRGQIGHEEFHFDNNAFEKSCAYMEEQHAIVIASLESNNVPSAWSAFGRLTHAAQDFYAHSNYIDLWLACQPDGAIPTPSEIHPVDPELINAGALRSGKVYLLRELLTMIGFLKPLVMPLLPRDSHAWMNLDSPDHGPNFAFAFQAAVKRTKIEFEKTASGLSRDLFTIFVDR